MEPIVLDDDEVRRRLDPARAVDVMRRTLVASATGRLHAPPRVRADLGDGGVLFTAGATDEWWGYRSYDTFGSDGDQVVVAHDRPGGRVMAVAVGAELGPRRTGATGAVAVDALARTDAAVLALIGTGRQAWTQLWAITAVRDLGQVRVWSRDPTRRADFVARARDAFRVDTVEGEGPRQVVAGADIVVLATSSPTPVLDPSWLTPGCHVTTLGPKQVGRAEFDVGLAQAATVLATDSTAQLAGYDPPFVLAGTPYADRVEHLGAVLAGQVPGRRSATDITLFCSVGLAGTEVALLVDLAGVPG